MVLDATHEFCASFGLNSKIQPDEKVSQLEFIRQYIQY